MSDQNNTINLQQFMAQYGATPAQPMSSGVQPASPIQSAQPMSSDPFAANSDRNVPQPVAQQTPVMTQVAPQQPMQQTATTQSTGGQMPGSLPMMAFPANQPRQIPYDPNILNQLVPLVNRKYRPTVFREYMRQNNLQIDPQMDQELNMAGPDISEEVFQFELARLYNKVEVDIYDYIMKYLPEEKRPEFMQIADNPNAAPNDPNVVQKIQQFLLQNIPNVQQLLADYFYSITIQYLMGRF